MQLDLRGVNRSTIALDIKFSPLEVFTLPQCGIPLGPRSPEIAAHRKMVPPKGKLCINRALQRTERQIKAFMLAVCVESRCDVHSHKDSN